MYLFFFLKLKKKQKVHFYSYAKAFVTVTKVTESDEMTHGNVNSLSFFWKQKFDRLLSLSHSQRNMERDNTVKEKLIVPTDFISSAHLSKLKFDSLKAGL